MFRRADSRPSVGLACLAIALAVSACAASPVATKRARTAATKPKASAAALKTSPKPTASPSPTPSPLPSLGLLLDGEVTVNPAKLLDGKLAEVTKGGIRLVSNNGAGIVSNNAGGLISDNGLGLISDNGLGYRTLAADSDLKPVEGMHVSAVALVDGKVLAGPVATDATGHYRLGFRKAPAGNFRVIAEVPAKPKDPEFTYATLVAPSPAPSDAPVVTSDSSRAVVSYILGVMPARLQPVVDARKAGTSAESYIARYDDMIEEVGINVYRALDQALAKIPAEKLKEMDGPEGGLITLGMSNRAIQFVDLSKPVYGELNTLIEEGHAYGVASATRPEPPLEDQVVALAKVPSKVNDIAPLLVKYGVPQAEADAYLARAKAIGVRAADDIALVVKAHQADVVGPIFAAAGGF